MSLRGPLTAGAVCILSVMYTICGWFETSSLCGCDLRFTEDDVNWSVNQFGDFVVTLKGDAKSAIEGKTPPIEDLMSRINDSQQFVAAHVVLNRLLGKASCCIDRIDGETVTLRYYGLTVICKVDQEQNQVISAVISDRDVQHEVLMSQWGVNNVAESVVRFRRALDDAARDTRGVLGARITLGGRNRNHIDKIRNTDVRWSVKGFASVKVALVGASRQVAEGRPSIEGLLESLHDDERWVASHVVLSRLFKKEETYVESTPRGYCVWINGLRVELIHDGELGWNPVYSANSLRLRLVDGWHRRLEIRPEW